MNVMHITYDMRIGGTEMVIKNLIEGNDDTSINMSIFCIEAPLGPWGDELQASGITITTQARQPGFDVKLISAIRKHIKVNQIDIVHCHQYTPWVYGAIAAAFTETKVIFTEHGRFYPDSKNWKRKLVNPVLLALTSKITAISKATKDALTEFEFIPNNKIDVIYNGIQPLEVTTDNVNSLRNTLGIASESLVLGTIARFDPIKNQVMMINAFAKATGVRDDVYLLLVGDGEIRNELQQQVDKLGISNKVIFSGYIAKPAHHLALMDIFLLSSLSEGTSMTLLEAMSLGKPCVVTDAGGNAEVVTHNINGLVTNNNDVDKFAKAISFLVENSAKRNEFGENAIQRFKQRFSASTMNETFRGQYKQLKPSVQ
ncbi:glycosyltransferase family 4 protein [Alteromonas sp. A081]|uniref:glycosyltransferase family 4 protein n=1 Tax=Alteromonas sp. A081 TaxID=3410269 RepID=UPI003B97FFC8